MKLSTNYAKVVVKKHHVQEAVKELSYANVIGLDTETYGVGYEDKMFSLVLCGVNTVFYFNLYGGADHLGNYAPVNCTLAPSDMRHLLPLFEEDHHLWAIHNAKFDMRRLQIEKVKLAGPVHCTYAVERIIKNNYMNYSLAACAKRRGWKKDDKVDSYIKIHKLYDMVQLPGKKKREKNMHFEKVPFDIMSNYALTDAILHRELAIDQLRKINELT